MEPENNQTNVKNDAEQSEIPFGKQLYNYFSEYSEVTGIHGLRYIGEQPRLLLEKFLWLLAVCGSLYCCIVVTMMTYKKWITSPVIVTFATTETPIHEIPFPAITICSETKSLPRLFNYTDLLYKKQDGIELDPTIEEQFSYISMLCNFHQELNYNGSQFLDDDVITFFKDVTPNFLEDISDCKYMGEDMNCSEIFVPVITDEGLCYSFNLLDRRDIFSKNVKHYKNFHLNELTDWSLEKGYDKSTGINAYPRRALFAGAIFALEMKIKILDEDLDFTCGNSIQGYKIQLHHPAMLPRPKQQHFRIPLDQSVIAAFMPTMITTSEAVQNYDPARRQCYFAHERKLKYFQTYNQQNCQIECRTNFTLAICGCVDFYMPREEGTPICGIPMRDCMKEADEERLSEGILSEINRPKREIVFKTPVVKCECMPECTSMGYAVENSLSEWDWVRKYHFDRNAPSYNKSTTHMSYVQLFFKGNQFITSERNELYGPTDFLANFGGLLGLFTGFSVISLIEIIYFLTLRIICNINIYGSKYWAGKKD